MAAAHKRDIARAEDALMVPYGTEVVGMQRDWNEELQSCREFSRENLQDRSVSGLRAVRLDLCLCVDALPVVWNALCVVSFCTCVFAVSKFHEVKERNVRVLILAIEGQRHTSSLVLEILKLAACVLQNNERQGTLQGELRLCGSCDERS